MEYPDLTREEAAARGALRRTGAIATGDYVDAANGLITKVYPAARRFVRPALANADLLCLVLAPVPEPDLLFCDKVLIAAACAGIPALIAVNKSDLGDAAFRAIEAEYAGAAKVLCVSAKTGDGLDALRELFRGKLVALAGQSAAGKTSLINALCGGERRTGGVSDKTLRGRHTTTASEIVRAGELRIADTPGFSAIDVAAEAGELADCYPEFPEGECRFRGCSHTTEPDCAVRRAAEEGRIPLGRYERYLRLYTIVKEKKS